MTLLLVNRKGALNIFSLHSASQNVIEKHCVKSIKQPVKHEAKNYQNLQTNTLKVLHTVLEDIFKLKIS